MASAPLFRRFPPFPPVFSPFFGHKQGRSPNKGMGGWKGRSHCLSEYPPPPPKFCQETFCPAIFGTSVAGSETTPVTFKHKPEVYDGNRQQSTFFLWSFGRAEGPCVPSVMTSDALV